MTAVQPLESHSTWSIPEPVALQPGDPVRNGNSPSRAIDVSRSRTHDAVLDILKAYKLSGNFHANLDAVLRDMGIFDKVIFQVAPNPTLDWPDCRHVVFTPRDNITSVAFDSIIKTLEARIGFDEPWWGRLFAAFIGFTHPSGVKVTAAQCDLMRGNGH